MVNEIKGNAHKLIRDLSGNQASGQVNSQTGASQDQGKKATGSDNSNVRLTNTADLLNSLKAKIANQPVVDTQRVTSIKHAVFDGTFNLNIEQTADKMADFENLLDSKLSGK